MILGLYSLDIKESGFYFGMETEIKKIKNMISMPIHQEKIIGKTLFCVFTIVIIFMSLVQVYGRATAKTNLVLITDIEKKIDTALEKVF